MINSPGITFQNPQIPSEVTLRKFLRLPIWKDCIILIILVWSNPDNHCEVWLCLLVYLHSHITGLVSSCIQMEINHALARAICVLIWLYHTGSSPNVSNKDTLGTTEEQMTESACRNKARINVFYTILGTLDMRVVQTSSSKLLSVWFMCFLVFA